MLVQFLGGEDPLEEEIATHSILVWKTPWTEEPTKVSELMLQFSTKNVMAYSYFCLQEADALSKGESGKFKHVWFNSEKLLNIYNMIVLS